MGWFATLPIARAETNGQGAAEAESDMGPGVLLSTGYIAGGAIGGVLVAFLSFSDTILQRMSDWHAPAESNVPALIFFSGLAVLLLIVGAGWWLKPPRKP